MAQPPTNQARLVLALARLKGIGPAWIKQALPALQAADVALATDTVECLRWLLKTKPMLDTTSIARALDEADTIIDQCSTAQIAVTAITDAHYPVLLQALKDPPPILYTRGHSELLTQVVAVIGTREPTTSGRIIAGRVGRTFADRGWAICNGLAAGIDLCAISDGTEYLAAVVGVLPSGLDLHAKVLSRQAGAAAEAVLAAGGLLVSEQAPTIAATTYTTIASCRIQAGLSQGLILIQSALGSGSRFAAATTAVLGRPIGAICPIATEREDAPYAANVAIVERGARGLSDFVEMHVEKFPPPRIVPIRGKDDYQNFAQALHEGLTVL